MTKTPMEVHEKEAFDIEEALQTYNQALKQQQDHIIDNAPTPTAQLTSFKDSQQTIILDNMETPYISNDYPNRQRHSKTVKNSIEKQRSQRDLTYESERSSIFKEDLPKIDIKKNRLPSQSRGKPVESQSHFKEEAGSPKILESQRSKNNSQGAFTGKIQQFLELNLKMQNIAELPRILFSKNQFLRTVDLRNNQITRLPDQICYLSILWKLRVDNNLLTELPNLMQKMERLEILTVSNNKLTSLPLSLFQIGKKLSMLQLNDNCISRIQREICQLKMLRVLLLHNNPLSRVPHELKTLSEMQEFSVDWFQYLQPPMSKIQKDERGQLMIKDFIKFCKTMSEVNSTQQCSFTHFLVYFHQLQELDQLQQMNVYAKQRSVLHYICLNGHSHLLKEIFKSCPSIDINQSDSDGTTPLVLAFKNKQAQVISYLMKQPITNFNKGSSKYGFPLHIAIKSHEFKTVLKMLKPKYVVNINARDEEGNNAMHYLMGHFSFKSQYTSQIASLLLKKGIEVNLLNKAELSPLHIAIKSFQNRALKYALAYNQFLRKFNQQSQLVHSKSSLRSSSNPFQQTSKFSLFDFSISAKHSWTPLHFAVYTNNIGAVELLLKARKDEGVDFFTRDADGKLAQELAPFNSSIYKIISKQQSNIIRERHSLAQQNEDQGGAAAKFSSQRKEFLQVKVRTEGIEHQNINKMQLLGKQNSVNEQRKQFRQGQLRRVNSNGQVWLPKFQQMVSNNKVDAQDLYFGAQEDNDDGQHHEENLTVQDSPEVNKSRGLGYRHKLTSKYRLGGMASSKTEKNLHSNSVYMTNFLENRGNNNQTPSLYKPQIENDTSNLSEKMTPFSRRGFAGVNKQSPKVLQRMPPLQPKAIQNTEEDQDNSDSDEMLQFEIEKQLTLDKLDPRDEIFRYVSEGIPQETESNGLKSSSSADVFLSLNDSQTSQDSSIELQSKSMYNDDSFYSQAQQMNSDQVESSHKRVQSKMNHKVFQFHESCLNQQYMSAPLKDQISPSKLLEGNLNGESLIYSKQRSLDQNDEDDDFCCAEDEEPDAGELGAMSNKINKFENNNAFQDINSSVLDQREVLSQVVRKIQDQTAKRRYSREKEKLKRQMAPVHGRESLVQSNQRKFIIQQQQVETPFNERIFEHTFSPTDSVLQGKEEEANVFDTVDVQEEIATPKMAFDPTCKRSMRDIKNKNNIFFRESSPDSRINNNFSNKQRAREDQHSMQGVGQGRLRDLNQQCKLEETVSTPLIDGNTSLSDPDMSLAQKYQQMYKLIYSCKDELLNESRIKAMFDQLGDSDENSIIKADLSYLISLSKSKDLIPVLDKQIIKMKAEQIQQQSKNNTQNFEGVLQEFALKSPLQHMKSPDEQSKTPKEAKSPSSKPFSNSSNCKKLVIYETKNAYEILMQEALLQSKQMMERYNKRINIERERSREKVKQKQMFSNYMHQSKIQDQSMTSKDQSSQRRHQTRETNNSVRGVPELVARLNKSPSSQNVSYGSKMQPSLNLDVSQGAQTSMISNADNSLVVGSGLSAFSKKTSFTPKGSTGQIFLAFQRQKQTANQIRAKQSPSYQMQQTENNVTVIDLQEENYNETLINLHLPKNVNVSNNRFTAKQVRGKDKSPITSANNNNQIKSEVQKQKTKIEPNSIIKRKQEARKQSALVEQHQNKEMSLQKRRGTPVVEGSLAARINNKNSSTSKKPYKYKERKPSPSKAFDISSTEGLEDKIRRNLMIANHRQTPKPNQDRRTPKQKLNNSSQVRPVKTLKTVVSSVQQSQLMKKSTSTSKLASELSYLQQQQ